MIGCLEILVLRGLENSRVEVSAKSVEFKLLNASRSFQTPVGKTECEYITYCRNKKAFLVCGLLFSGD